jgi:hypothetical protein
MNRPLSTRLRRAAAGLLLAALIPPALATITTASAPAPSASSPLVDGVSSRIADDAAMAFWYGDFDRLEALYRSVRQSTELVDGGTSRLQWFRKGLWRVYGRDDATDPYFAQLEALTHAWASKRPNSALAQLLYARALHARAWSFRGGDYADHVLPAAMKEFHRYIALEKEQLDRNASLLKNESTADIYLLMIGRTAVAPFDQMHALALDALARNPADDSGFQELATASLPKWGGSADLFDAVAREAARRARPGSGMAMYAFLYDDVSGDFPGDLFETSDVDWPTMRQGFRDWLARWPNRYMLNRFARDACHAQDKPTTLEVLNQIGDQPLERAWGNQFESCRRWAREP